MAENMKRILIMVTVILLIAWNGVYAFGQKSTAKAPIPAVANTKDTKDNIKRVKNKKTENFKEKKQKKESTFQNKTLRTKKSPKIKDDIRSDETSSEAAVPKTEKIKKSQSKRAEAKVNKKNEKVKNKEIQKQDTSQMTDKQKREIEYVQNYYRSTGKTRSKLALKLNPNLDIREVRASHILVKKRADAVQIRKDIMNGTISFEEAARRYSLCPSGPYGGDLGFFDRKKMAQQFADTAFDLNIGEISMPVGTKFGWHIIKTTDKR